MLKIPRTFSDMISVIFLIIFAFEFADTLQYGKENNDYGYRSLLSSSLEGKSEGQRYGSVQQHAPTHRYRRDGEHHHQRPSYHSRPPSPGRISYRKPRERRYDGGHRGGFRSAQNKRGGYGRGKELHNSRSYSKGPGGYGKKYFSYDKSGFEKTPWDSYSSSKSPWDTFNTKKSPWDSLGDSSKWDSFGKNKKNPWDSFGKKKNLWSSFGTNKKDPWDFGNNKNNPLDSLPNKKDSWDFGTKKKNLWDLFDKKEDPWDKKNPWNDFGKSNSGYGKFSDYSYGVYEEHKPEKANDEKQGKCKHQQEDQSTMDLPLGDGYMGGVGYTQDDHNYRTYSKDYVDDRERYGQRYQNKYGSEYSNSKYRAPSHYGNNNYKGYHGTSSTSQPYSYDRKTYSSRNYADKRHMYNQKKYAVTDKYNSNRGSHGGYVDGGYASKYHGQKHSGYDSGYGTHAPQGYRQRNYDGSTKSSYHGHSSKGYSRNNHRSYSDSRHGNYDKQSSLKYNQGDYGTEYNNHKSYPTYTQYSYKPKPTYYKDSYDDNNYGSSGYNSNNGYDRGSASYARGGDTYNKGYTEPYQNRYTEHY